MVKHFLCVFHLNLVIYGFDLQRVIFVSAVVDQIPVFKIPAMPFMRKILRIRFHSELLSDIRPKQPLGHNYRQLRIKLVPP